MSHLITKTPSGLSVPTHPVIPFIEGDGIGPDIWRATQAVVEAAVSSAYGTQRGITWLPVTAGQQAFDATGEWLTPATVEAIRSHLVAIKGPLTTPVGGGIRSLNVALRQQLDLFACVRPVRWFQGVPSPVRHPEFVDMVIFRENTEDVYAGMELESESASAQELIGYLSERYGWNIRPGSGLGIKKKK